MTFWEASQAAGWLSTACSYGSQAFRLWQASFFFFFFACSQPSFRRVFKTEILVSTALSRAAQAAVTLLSDPGIAARSSSMGFGGTYLLFCLFSILSQVTTESPTPKTKKATNVKKGKQGQLPHCAPLCSSPSCPTLVRVLPGLWWLEGPHSRDGCQNCNSP